MTESQPSPEAPHEAPFFTSIRGWGFIRGEQSMLGGVVDGVSRKIGMATGPARILTVVAAIFLGGIVTLAYGVGWALLPDRYGRIVIQEFGRGRPNVGALIGAGLFTIIGLNSLGEGALGGSWRNGDPWGLVVLAILAAVAYWIVKVTVLDKRNETSPPPVAEPIVPPAPAAQAKAKAGTKAAAAKATSGAAKSGASSASIPAPEPVYAAPPTPRAAAPAPTYAPPRPPVPRIPGPGKQLYLATLAIALIGAAGVWWAERQDNLRIDAGDAWWAGLLALVGLAIIAAGVMGRRIGFLGFAGTVLVLGWLIRLIVVPAAENWDEDHEFSWGDDGIHVVNSDGEEVASLTGDGVHLTICTNEADGDAPTFGDGNVFYASEGDSTSTILSLSQELNSVEVRPNSDVTVVNDTDGMIHVNVTMDEEGLYCDLVMVPHEVWSVREGTDHTTTIGITADDSTIVIEEKQS